MFSLYNIYYNQLLVFKGLSKTTLEAYSCDVLQFCACCDMWEEESIRDNAYLLLERFFKSISTQYSAKSIRRKMSSIKAFLNFLYSSKIVINPNYKEFRYRVKTEKNIPKFILKSDIQKMITFYEKMIAESEGTSRYRENLRRGAIIEFLYLTGVRVEELCNVKSSDIYINDESVIINGKGRKQRLVPFTIGRTKFARLYYSEFAEDIQGSGSLFVNKWAKKLSTQSVRQVVSRLEGEIDCKYTLTPHMFRHTLASNLLENGVNMRIVQEILGHSSIKTTEIYTHVSISSTISTFLEKHPYNSIV